MTRTVWLAMGGGVAAVAIAATLAVSRPGGDAADPAQLLRANDAQVVALGQTIYTAECAACHGTNLEGEVANWRSPGPDGLLPAPPHDATGHTWHHPDQVLFDITKLGVARAANLQNHQSAMPAYEGVLTDDEIIAVLSFIKSTWPDDIRERHDELNRVYNREPRS
ncbi:MAG: cytochrome c [Silicimonas sp.]|jgi:mono/diheme cytochrome c family protein|uniref:c-type cytochrome n=1 Tax=Roseitalea porphyridii TaxID=1852022 RepID=UPI0032EAE14E